MDAARAGKMRPSRALLREGVIERREEKRGTIGKARVDGERNAVDGREKLRARCRQYALVLRGHTRPDLEAAAPRSKGNNAVMLNKVDTS